MMSAPDKSMPAGPTTAQDLQTLLDLVAQAVWETDAAGKVVSDSPSWRVYTGQTLGQWLGEGWTGAVHPDDRVYALSQWQQAVARQQSVDAEFRLRSPDGGWRWTNVRATPIRQSDGSIEKWLGLNIDISAGKAAQAQLQQREQLLNALVQHLPGGAAFVVDSQLRYQLAEGEALHQVGAKSADFIGKTLFEALDADTAAAYEPQFRQALEGESFTAEHQIQGHYFESKGVPLRDANGDIDAVLVLSYDVTQRKRGEAALRESEAKYRTLFDSIDEGFNTIEMLFDGQQKAVDCRILEINPAYSLMTGLGHQIVGQRLRTFLPSIEERVIERYGQVVRTGEPVRFEEYVAGLDRWFDCFAVRIGDECSHLLAVVFNNITERKRAEDALRQAAQRKDEFLAMLAHELRNPLAPVRNGLQLLAQTHPADPILGSMLPMMNRQMDHLLRMLDDLLDVSRISRGLITLRKQRIDLSQVVAQGVEAMRPLYISSGRQLRAQLPDYPLYVEGDATRLNQVVTNLLTNGLRYTHEGGQVGLVLESLGEQALMRVRDNGIGLAADQLTAIFELFVQVDKSLARSHGGLGLGLSLVQELVERHGGWVEVHSPGLEQGSEFAVYLPLLTT